LAERLDKHIGDLGITGLTPVVAVNHFLSDLLLKFSTATWIGDKQIPLPYFFIFCYLLDHFFFYKIIGELRSMLTHDTAKHLYTQSQQLKKIKFFPQTFFYFATNAIKNNKKK
jgi:hypothetical protein